MATRGGKESSKWSEWEWHDKKKSWKSELKDRKGKNILLPMIEDV
jgi:hypothetical protein